MCLSSCGMLYKGQPLKDITCPCGLGYWDIFQERFVTGDQIRDGAPPRREYEAKVKARLKEGEFDSRLREQFIRHFFGCKKKLALDNEALQNGTGEPSSRLLAEAELREIAKGDFKSRGSTALREYYLPAEGIRQEVLDHHCQDKNTFGSAASVRPGTRAGRPGYYIRTTKEISIALISELKRDSIVFEENMRQTAHPDQAASVKTVRSGPGARPGFSITPRDFDDLTYGVGELARDTQGVRITSDQSGRPEAQVERREDLTHRRESGEVIVARRDARLKSRETRYVQRDGTRHDSEPQKYPPRSVQTNPYDRHRQGDTSYLGRDVVLDTRSMSTDFYSSPLLDTRSMSTDSYSSSLGSSRTSMSSTAQFGSQHKYTRKDVEQLVAKKLKELGRQQVGAEDFRALVDREFRKLNEVPEQRSRVSPQAYPQGARESSQITTSTFERSAAAADPLLEYNQASQNIARQEHQDTRTDADIRRQANIRRSRDPRDIDDPEPEDSPPPRRHDSSRRQR